MAWFQRDVPSRRPPATLVERLCQESGHWMLVRREGDRYWVQANDHKSVVEIMIRTSKSLHTMLFQAWFPVRFPLDHPPSGLFARLLLRNHEHLTFSRWSIAIGQSCEACPTVSAQLPRSSMDADLFDHVCRQIRDEIRGFHAELHEKFRYAAPPVQGRMPADVHFDGPCYPAIAPAEDAARMIIDQGGHVRHRLPGRREGS